MKVLLTTGRDARHNYFLAQAIGKFADSIAGVIIQVPGTRRSKKTAERKAVNAIPDRWIKLNYLLQSKRISLHARATFRTSKSALASSLSNYPVVRTEDINSEDTVSFIRNLSADMMLVFGGKILKTVVIEKFESGILNLHLGLSPHYRGANCIEWPLYHGNRDLVGCTVHYIDEGIDSGAIVRQMKIDPVPGESPVSVMMRSYTGGIALLTDTFKRINGGESFAAIPQESAGFCYYARHFSPEIRYGVFKRARRESTCLLARIEKRMKRSAFGMLKVRSYSKLMPHLPYPAILLYHDIGDRQSPYLKHCDLTIGKRRFEEHVGILSESYKVVSVEEIFEACQKGDKLEDAIAFTFDDGYKSLSYGLEVLQRAGCPANVYINSDFASGIDAHWRNKLSYLVEYEHVGRLKALLAEELGCGVKVSRRDVFSWTKRRIKDPRIELAVRKVFSEYGDDDWQDIYATWEELRGVDPDLFQVGNHSKSHLNMTSLPPKQQAEQIVDGKQKIREMLGGRDVGFSIPFGERTHYDETTIEIAEREHNFYLTAHGGLNVVGLQKEARRIGIPDVDACQLPRILWQNL